MYILIVDSCLLALRLIYDNEQLTSIGASPADLVANDAETQEFQQLISNHLDMLDATLSMANTAFNGFTKFANATVGSPIGFNNFWNL